MSLIITILIVAAVLALAIGLAYLPMRLLLGTIARNVREFIQRQRDRRSEGRGTPDRRKEEAAAAATASVSPGPPPEP